MTGEWRNVEFSEVLLNGTRNGVYKKKEFHGSGIKIVNMGELFANPRLFDVPMKRVELSESELEKSLLQPGDLLFARRSLVAEGAGKCSIVMKVNEPTTFESSIIRARPDPERANSLFLYYLFNSPWGRYLLGTILRQVAVSGITGSDLLKLCVRLSPLPEQHALAHILGTLDNKIELNRRMNKTLESIARAIFKSWFIDFEPIPGLGPHKEWEDSGLGKIPKGWSVKTLEQLIDIKHGYAFKGEFFSDNSSRDILLTPGNFAVGGGFKWDKLKYYEGPVDEAYVLHEWDLLVTMTDLSKNGDTLGYPAFVPRSDKHRFLHNQRLGKIILKHPVVGFNFLYYLMKQSEYRHHVLGGATGTTVKHTAPNRIKDFRFICPPETASKPFEDIVGNLNKKNAQNEIESQTLADIRDALLPKLLSGEIRIKDAEKIVSQTV